MKIIGSHVDSPRLDLKPNPLYEDSELSLMKLTTTVELNING